MAHSWDPLALKKEVLETRYKLEESQEKEREAQEKLRERDQVVAELKQLAAQLVKENEDLQSALQQQIEEKNDNRHSSHSYYMNCEKERKAEISLLRAKYLEEKQTLQARLTSAEEMYVEKRAKAADKYVTFIRKLRSEKLQVELTSLDNQKMIAVKDAELQAKDAELQEKVRQLRAKDAELQQKDRQLGETTAKNKLLLKAAGHQAALQVNCKEEKQQIQDKSRSSPLVSPACSTSTNASTSSATPAATTSRPSTLKTTPVRTVKMESEENNYKVEVYDRARSAAAKVMKRMKHQ